jgi:hypothetical protein
VATRPRHQKPCAAIKTNPSSGTTGLVCRGPRAGNALLRRGSRRSRAGRPKNRLGSCGNRRGPRGAPAVTCGRLMTPGNSRVGMRSVVMNVREVPYPPVDRLLDGPQFKPGDAHRHVETGLAFEAQRLKRERII